MCGGSVRVALIDSGLSASQTDWQAAGQCFDEQNMGVVATRPILPDKLQHGSLIAQVIIDHLPQVEIINAQVFTDRLYCTPAVVAAAIDWALVERAEVIAMSFGVKKDQALLRESCQRARASNCILIAASPAQGGEVYPAAYEGVIRFTGDARCRPGEFSALRSSQADFGAHAWPLDKAFCGDRRPHKGGASYAVAWGVIATASLLEVQPDATAEAVFDAITLRCRYCGRERRLTG